MPKPTIHTIDGPDQQAEGRRGRAISFPLNALLVLGIVAVANMAVYQAGLEYFVQIPSLVVPIRNIALALALLVGGRLLIGRMRSEGKRGAEMVLLGSVLQALCLLLYLPFDGLVSLYVISALFGLFQGGIVPSYAVIVRQFFPARDTGLRVGLVLSATIAGMALLTLLPMGVLQLKAAIEHGYWYARSAEFMQQPIIELLVWLRVPDDMIFSVGALALAWFVFRLWVGPKQQEVIGERVVPAG